MTGAIGVEGRNHLGCIYTISSLVRGPVLMGKGECRDSSREGCVESVLLEFPPRSDISLDMLALSSSIM